MLFTFNNKLLNVFNINISFIFFFYVKSLHYFNCFKINDLIICFFDSFICLIQLLNKISCHLILIFSLKSITERLVVLHQ
jgi:hypothetical protein